MDSTTYLFGEWEFEPASGDLRRSDGQVTRIQPQPAQLLTLLLERAGDVVTRDDIVNAVWSDTIVEFDQAVNYAVRHLRAALNESAAEPRFIETLPRRGYRFAAPIERRVVPDKTALGGTSGRRTIAPAGIFVLVLATAWGGWRQLRKPAALQEEAPLVAVLTLRHEANDSVAALGAVRVAEGLTDRLTRLGTSSVRVAGPTITDAYNRDENPRARVRDALGASFVVSGRFTPDETDGLFLELIRIADGAHVWAMRADPADPTGLVEAGDSVVAQVLRILR